MVGAEVPAVPRLGSDACGAFGRQPEIASLPLVDLGKHGIYLYGLP